MAAIAPRPRRNSVDALDEWLRWAVGLMAGGCFWFLRVLNGKADRTELTAYMKEAREAREGIHAKLDEVSKATQQTAVCVAKLEGRLTSK